MVVEAREQPAQFRLDPSGREGRAIGLRGQRETLGHPVTNNGAQFAERGCLAADERHVLRSDILEPADDLCCRHRRLLHCLPVTTISPAASCALMQINRRRRRDRNCERAKPSPLID
jgi:hypothetical protein